MVSEKLIHLLPQRLVACSLLLLFSATAQVFAESLKIGGLNFPVDAITDVDSSNVKVTLFGESHIVARTQLEEFVAQRFLSNPQAAARLPSTALSSFVQQSVAQNKINLAVDGLLVLCNGSAANRAELAAFVSALPASENTDSFFKAAAVAADENRCNGAVAAELIVRAGVHDIEWTKSRGIRIAFDYETEVRALCDKRILEAGANRSAVEMEQLIQFYGAVFGNEDPRFLQLKLLHSRLTHALQSSQNGDVEALYPLIEQSKTDPELAVMVSPLLMESLHSQAAKAIARKDPQAAIGILSHFDISKRTPTTHQLVEKSLRELSVSEPPVVADAAVASFLGTLAQVDESVKDAYLDYLQRVFDSFLSKGRVDEVNTYFGALTAVRPDPNVANDQLRIRQISGYLNKKMLFLAREKLRQVQTGVPFFSELRFAIAGLYFDPMYIVIAIVSPLAAGLVILLVEVLAKVRRRLTRAFSKENSASVEDEDEEIQPAFVRSGLARAMSPSMIEYRECLKVFGLAADVDLKAIKAAYRIAVKEVHPDLHQNLDRGAAERFLLLTKTYERILELHEQVQVPKLSHNLDP